MAGFKVKIGADKAELTKNLAELRQDLAKTKVQIEKAGDSKGFTKLNQTILAAEKTLNGFGAKSVETVFARIDASIEKSAQEARAFKTELVNLGNARLPLTSILQLQASVARLKADLKTGFAPTITKAFEDTGKAASAAATKIKQLPVGSNQAAQSLTNLSRIAQDAPFGFIGIQNNLNPLIESFGRLKQETGSSAAAFKSLLAGLAGPAGVGLALGVVTGLVTVAVQKYGSLGTALNALFNGYDALAQANRDLSKSFAEATGQAAGEQAAITSLVGIARNEALSREARNEAINKLNKEYDEFLPKLTLENINTQAVTDSVNKLSEALLRQAKIKGVQDLIAKEFERLTKTMTDLGESSGFLDVLKASITGAGSSVKTGSDLIARGFKNQAEAVEDSKKRIALFNGVLNELLTTEAKEGTLFTEMQKKGADALKERIEQLKKLQSLAGLATSQLVELAQLEIQLVQRDAAKLTFTKEEVQQQIDAIIKKAFPDEFLDARFKIRVLGEIDPAQVQTDLTDQVGALSISDALGIGQIDTVVFDPLIKKMREASEAKRELFRIEKLQEFAEFVSGTLQPAFTNLFESLISGGKNAFQELAQALGQIIKRLIAAAAAAALLAGLVTLITGGSAAGAASFGANFKSLFSGFTGFQFAEGGIATRATRGIFGEAGPEAVIPLARLPQIIGQMNNSGGSGGEFTAKIVDGGRDLVLIMNRANKSFNRNF